MVQKLYIFFVIFYSFSVGCTGGEKDGPKNEDESLYNLEEQRLNTYTVDIGPHYSFETLDFGEETEHTMSVYFIHRESTAQIEASDRAMTRIVFFWDDEATAAQKIDSAGAYEYNYWWENDVYEVDFEVTDASFTKERHVFELNAQTYTSQTLWEGVAELSAEDEHQHACRFNRSLLNFAWAQMAQRVGDGECWTLINEALKEAQAHQAVHYRFGSLLTSVYAGESVDLSSVFPGDIIQFDQAHFEHTDGSWSVAGEPNHTALLRSVHKEENRVTVYEQNAPVGGPTVIGSYDLSLLVSGGFYIYRPYPSALSPEEPICEEPFDSLYAYEYIEDMTCLSPILETIAIEQGNTTQCQRACDDNDRCLGFSVLEERCNLHDTGTTSFEEGSIWFQKIR